MTRSLLSLLLLLAPLAAAHAADVAEPAARPNLLFNLRDDLGEKNNLAAREPQLVAQLDALIETFRAETGLRKGWILW